MRERCSRQENRSRRDDVERKLIMAEMTSKMGSDDEIDSMEGRSTTSDRSVKECRRVACILDVEAFDMR